MKPIFIKSINNEILDINFNIYQEWDKYVCIIHNLIIWKEFYLLKDKDTKDIYFDTFAETNNHINKFIISIKNSLEKINTVDKVYAKKISKCVKELKEYFKI